MSDLRSTQVIRHESEIGRWESAVRQPHVSLRPYVREYFGGSEETFVPLCRRELPTEIAPLIINFGPPFRIFDSENPARWTDHRSFVAGASDRYVLVGSTGAYSCMQVNFTILGMRLFLGRPLRDFANQVVSLDDVFGGEAMRLTMQLYEAPTWDMRFDILERMIGRRLSSARIPPPAVSWMWNRLARSGGQVAIKLLAEQVGWSHKHVVSQFTEQIGLAPKTIARVLRFGRAAEFLKNSERGRLAEIANDCGYYDQAHFTRDFRAFSGVSPTELLASRLPDRGGFVV
jgi:AraC-like DNA-binding protein